MPRPKKTRSYDSAQRDAQVERTRRRILDATLRVLARGASAFTVPAVAEEANVSLPTVYRLFANKRELAAAARLEVRDRIGIDPSPIRSLDELIERQIEHIRNVSTVDDVQIKTLFDLSAQPLSEAAASEAKDAVAAALKPLLAGVRGKERKYLVNAVTMLFSSAGALMLWRYRLMNDEGAETFTWTVRTLTQAISEKGNRRGE